MQELCRAWTTHLGRSVDAKGLPALLYCICQLLENQLRVFPTNAGIGDGDAVLETSTSLFGNFLVAWNAPVSLYASKGATCSTYLR